MLKSMKNHPEKSLQIVFLFYDGMTALDAIGPHEVLWRWPGVKVQCVAKNAGPVRCGSGLQLIADTSLSQVSRADILVVPGSVNATSLQHFPEILDWVRSIHKTTTWTTSVCTGSLILGAAGILSGLKATSHWAVLDRLKTWGAEPVRERVVEDGKVMTAAGVSAGIDMALTLTAKVMGTRFAQLLQLGLEYDPKPPFDAGSPEKAHPEVLETLRAHLKTVFE